MTELAFFAYKQCLRSFEKQKKVFKAFYICQIVSEPELSNFVAVQKTLQVEQKKSFVALS